MDFKLKELSFKNLKYDFSSEIINQSLGPTHPC